MLQGQIPDGEGFELSITGLDAALVFMVKLRQAGRHLAAARAGGRYNHQRTRGFYIIVLAVAIITDDMLHIMRIAFNRIMIINLNIQSLQLILEAFDGFLASVLRNNNAAYIQALSAVSLHQTQHVQIIGQAEVMTHLVIFNIVGIYGNNHFCLVCQLQEHLQLTVRSKARQHAGSMIIIEQLAAEFQIKLIAKFTNALSDMLRLHGQIFLIIKAYFHVKVPQSQLKSSSRHKACHHGTEYILFPDASCHHGNKYIDRLFL